MAAAHLGAGGGPDAAPMVPTGPVKGRDPRAVYAGLAPRAAAGIAAPGFAALQQEARLCYDQARYPFRALVQEALRVEDLDTLHTAFGFSRTASLKQQKKRALAPILAKLENRGGLNALMDLFVCEFVAPHMAAQQPPGSEPEAEYLYGKFCLRVQPPAENNIGYAHCDAQYQHQPGQINFWLPLTEANARNSLYVESSPGNGDFHPFLGGAGDVFRFYGNQCFHHTVANTSDVTRVSIDFRVVPGSCFDADPAASRQRNGYQKFQVGVDDDGYYSRCRRVDGGGFATDNTFAQRRGAERPDGPE
eukprot:TRINITY_DN25570_c0_g1_i1.p1 TRINITY_DN25570_c0_g1~~TRINITY_DN25570_c0_g1_i1.p1  ORF type:complete len:305 (+),score=98.93 TRINITY_DN25570_c0_g1_i1:24-938(+)